MAQFHLQLPKNSNLWLASKIGSTYSRTSVIVPSVNQIFSNPTSNPLCQLHLNLLYHITTYKHPNNINFPLSYSVPFDFGIQKKRCILVHPESSTGNCWHETENQTTHGSFDQNRLKTYKSTRKKYDFFRCQVVKYLCIIHCHRTLVFSSVIVAPHPLF